MSDEIENKYFKLFPSDGEFKPLTKEQSLARAKNSILEAWFDAMKASPWYRAMLGGYDRFLGDGYSQHEVSLARDNLKIFGDIRKQTFETWWMSKGYHVFSEQVPYMPMKALSVKYPNGKVTRADKEVEISPEAYLTIEVPLNLARQALHDQLDEILDEIDRYEGKFNRWRYSTADLHLSKELKKGTDPALIKSKLNVYTYYEKELKRKSDISLHKLCDDLKIPDGLTSKDYEHLSQAEIDQKKKDAVSEILKDARALMANALFREFPDTTEHRLARHFAFSEFAKYVDKVPETKFDSNVSRRNRKKQEAAAAAKIIKQK
jgi:hypothetical protein